MVLIHNFKVYIFHILYYIENSGGWWGELRAFIALTFSTIFVKMKSVTHDEMRQILHATPPHKIFKV